MARFNFFKHGLIVGLKVPMLCPGKDTVEVFPRRVLMAFELSSHGERNDSEERWALKIREHHHGNRHV